MSRHESARVLFLSNYFPPETNALATRTFEHAREWARAGGDVEVLAGPPHFPEGHVYDGFQNRLSRQRIDGIDVLRVPMYVAANQGFFKRTVSYLSYMASAVWYAESIAERPGVVVASSPQFFAGFAGLFVSRRLRRPFVLEVRDLWPESIVDVGAVRRGIIVRLLEWLEGVLYRAADKVVIVSPAFRAHIEARGVPSDAIVLLPNGVDPEQFGPPALDELAELKTELGLEGKFVASYIGTVGMAHGVDVMLEAALRCADDEIAFLVVGAGARWQALRNRACDTGATNFLVVEKQPRERMRVFYGLSDVSIVPLLDRPAFRSVIPSKMFESMAMRIPVILGVKGQAQRILEESGAGVAVAPEDPDALLAAVRELKADRALGSAMGEAGAAFIRERYDRRRIAARYWEVLQSVAAST